METCDCCSVNKYEEADRLLTNCFEHSAGQAGGEGEPQEEETADHAMAWRFVEMLVTQRPMNVAGLEQLVKRKEDLISGEAEVSLDAVGFLQVTFRLPQPHRVQAVQHLSSCDESWGGSGAVCCPGPKVYHVFRCCHLPRHKALCWKSDLQGIVAAGESGVACLLWVLCCVYPDLIASPAHRCQERAGRTPHQRKAVLKEEGRNK